ncbi:MAG: phosphoserine transaminase [Hyphomicrobium sp.]|nr:phosphoserine transaminase [Hyphomicrobium sp.]
MSRPAKPTAKPARPHFSSGPCAKRPGWTTAALDGVLSGRSHRSIEGRARLKLAIDKTRAILDVPDGYEIAILPGSDTGAFEIAMWNLLGPRGVDVFAWEVFGRIWMRDAVEELRLQDLRTFDATWGVLPDIGQADFTRDVLFTWNGTTTGVRVPDANWIPDDRAGLTFCDATSALFAQYIDLTKIDVLTYSWQKALGSEAAHGMAIFSARALERLETHRPAWPVPKLFRLTNAGGVLRDVFEGVTINTPSMLCLEDYLDSLAWVEKIGGLPETIGRADRNAKIVYDWIARTPWVEVLAADAATRSNTSVCMRFADPEIVAQGEAAVLDVTTAMTAVLAEEGAAFDLASYRGVTPGFRIWTGTTVEEQDLRDLTPWLEWAYGEVKARASA